MKKIINFNSTSLFNLNVKKHYKVLNINSKSILSIFNLKTKISNYNNYRYSFYSTKKYPFSYIDNSNNNDKSDPNLIKFKEISDNDFTSISQDNIRNFCIIAHIDHGKSTLSDRILEECGIISNLNKSNQQVLDNLKVERERGITVKAQTASMFYDLDGKSYLLNLIDTPGHVDFSFEVIRSLKPCQGAILLIDASKGVQAQTVANYNHAKKLNLKIIPVINKIDLPGAEIIEVEQQIFETFPDEFINDIEEGSEDDNTIKEAISNKIIKISAKTGYGIINLMSSIISCIPCPKGNINKTTRILLYDAKYIDTKGVILYIEVLDGKIKKGDTIKSYYSNKTFDVFEVGAVQPNLSKLSLLKTGQVGYIITNMKDIKEAKIGDTLYDNKETNKSNIKQEELFAETKSMVFSGIYPTDPSDYPELKKNIEKLQLTDCSLKVENETSASLGAGFRIGFLGLLHLDVFHQRLDDEYDLDVIITSPSTPYKIKVKPHAIKTLEVDYPNIKIDDKRKFNEDRTLIVENVISCPNREAIESIEEPIVEAEIITPKEYYQTISNLVYQKRGEEIVSEELSFNKTESSLIKNSDQNIFIKAIFEIPMNEIMIDFYDKLKSISKGYASFDYKLSEYRTSSIKICSFLVHGEKVDALSFFAHESNADFEVRKMCKKLHKHMNQQLFAYAIQGKIENKIVCREDVKALRKNVTAKCYGGDITRKMKLLNKQKKGKKKMRQLGNVEFSSETFYNILKDSSNDR